MANLQWLDGRRVYVEKFLPYFEQGSGCWRWQGQIDACGYGKYTGQAAHRIAYALFKGPIPEGLQIDHLCRTRDCVNPDHMEPVTHAENMRRSAPAQKTHCVNGHLLDEANTYVRLGSASGRRTCRACNRMSQARYLARKQAMEVAA